MTINVGGCLFSKAEPGGLTYFPFRDPITANMDAEKAVSGFAKDAVHYQILEQQPIEIMQALMSPEQFFGFCWGNVIKYALRCGNKDSRAKEMQKVAQYAMWATQALDGTKVDLGK